MINYYFDLTSPHHPYTSSLPATSGTMSPVNALRVEPDFADSFWPCEKDGEWTQIEDHRETEGYLNGKPYTVKDLGPLPKAFSLEPPAPTPEEGKQLRIAEIKSRLVEIDMASIRSLRVKAYGTVTPEDDAKLAALEQEAGALRVELAGLNE